MRVSLHLNPAILAILIFFVTSCAIPLKTGKQLYEHGEYDEAISAYQKALETNPKDTEAKDGIARSRSKLLDAQVEKIHKARTSGENTVQMNLDLMDLENKWGAQPSREAFYQQSDESDRASSQALTQLTDPALEKYPLKRQIELNRVARLFKESHSWDYNLIKIRTENEGKKLCQDFIRKSGGSYPYLDSFTSRFCRYWKANVTPKTDTHLIDRDLVSAVVLNFDLKNFPEQSRNQITVRLNDALQTTPWYSQTSSRALNISVSGSWEDSQNLKLHLQGSGKLSGQTIELSLQDESEMPANPTLVQTWLNKRLANLAGQFSVKLFSAWKDMYCTDIPVEEFAYSGELVQKCQKYQQHAEQPAIPAFPAFIDAWYLRYMGMDGKSTDLVLKRGSS